MTERPTSQLSDDNAPYDWLYRKDVPLPDAIESQRTHTEIIATQQTNHEKRLGEFVVEHIVDGTLEAHGIQKRETEPPIGGSSHNSGNIRLFPTKGYKGSRRKK